MIDCADCPDTVLRDDQPEAPMGRPPSWNEGAREEPGPSLESALAVLFESRFASVSQSQQEMVFCGSCTAEAPAGVTECPACGAEIWYEDGAGEAELGEGRIEQRGWIRLMHGEQFRLDPVAQVLAADGVELRLTPMTKLGHDVAMFGLSPSARSEGGALCALDVHVNDLERADELIAMIAGDPEDTRFSTEHLARVPIPDIELCEFLVTELGQLGVEASRIYQDGEPVLLVPPEMADVVLGLLNEFVE